jgi:HlyD family secretion protein
MKKKIKILTVLGVIALAAFLSYQYALRLHVESSSAIKVSGNIEATDVRLAFRVPGKISVLLTDEGKKVNKGDIVARLDTDELEKIKEEAESALRAAEYTATLAQADSLRADNLFEAGAISAQKRDAAKTSADSAKANVDALTASLKLASTRLGFAELASPLAGFVLVKSAEEGEVVPAGATVFTVADLNDVWVTAYVNETDLGRVRLGQEARVKTDTYPDKSYRGRVSFISQEAEFTPKQIQTTEERVKLVYRIKVSVENEQFDLKPGMPADAYIIE